MAAAPAENDPDRLAELLAALDDDQQPARDSSPRLEALHQELKQLGQRLHQAGEAAPVTDAECDAGIQAIRKLAGNPLVWKRSGESALSLPSESLVGRMLGPCHIQKLLGTGGMGTVYCAHHQILNRMVAVKVLKGVFLNSGTPMAESAAARSAQGNSHAVGDPELATRFQREILAVCALRHPHIIEGLDFGQTDGLHYLVLELIDGCDLSAVAARIDTFSIAEACEIARQTASALQHIHEHGLVHRDVKPSNLLLSQSGGRVVVKLIDLGLALLRDPLSSDTGPETLTATGEVMGTIDYISPEQTRDTHRVDIRSDLYSLGATLYRLLAGQAPFSAQAFTSLFQQVQALSRQPPQPLTSLRPDAPPALQQIVHRLLEKNPDQRFQTPQELQLALEPFCEGADLRRLHSR